MRRVAPLLLVVITSCVSGSVPPAARPARFPRPVSQPEPAAPVGLDPQIRIGLIVGTPRVSIAGAEGLVAGEPDGARVTTIPPGQTWQIAPVGERLALVGPTGWVSPSLDALVLSAAAPSDPIRINGKP